MARDPKEWGLQGVVGENRRPRERRGGGTGGKRWRGRQVNGAEDGEGPAVWVRGRKCGGP